MKNRILFDNIISKYKLTDQMINEGDKAFANVGRILYTMTEEEFIKLQEIKKC